MSTNPPVQPAEMPSLSEPARWPKTVGVISVVWGSIGLLCGTCGFAYMIFMPQLMRMAEEQFKEPVPSVMLPGLAAKVFMVLGMLPPPILLAGGIALLRRKAAARPLHLVYAVLATILMIGGTVVQAQQQLAIMQWAKENASSKWAQQGNSPTGLLIGFVMLLIFLIWPLFCMVWFGGIKRDPSEWTVAPEPPAA